MAIFIQLYRKGNTEPTPLDFVDKEIADLFGKPQDKDGNYFFRWFDAIGFSIARENDVINGCNDAINWFCYRIIYNINSTPTQKCNAIFTFEVFSRISKFLIKNYDCKAWSD